MYSVSETTTDYERQIYGILDLLGDFGGVMEVILLIADFILRPVSMHSFLTKAISKLYKASTKDENLFKKSNNKKAVKMQKLAKKHLKSFDKED